MTEEELMKLPLSTTIVVVIPSHGPDYHIDLGEVFHSALRYLSNSGFDRTPKGVIRHVLTGFNDGIFKVKVDQ